ncbi:kinesin-like protein KIN-14D isoform X2 [Panicum virgatum]|nr:kinesin-like protein KIN-14D isoform X2 [Panicum virgatum]
MKSSSLENAPTQSLLGVVNSILDESIERKNGQIPYRTASLLRKVIVEIERRISTQAGHIRNQNNLIKAREEKYQSRIRVLEALACGARGQTHVERDKLEGKGQLAEDDMARLMQYEEDLVRLMKEKEDMIWLLKEKEDMIRLLKEKEDMVRLLKIKEDAGNLNNDKMDRLLKEKDDTVVRLTKEKDDMVRLLKDKEDIIRLMKEKEDMVNVKDVTVEDTQRATDESKRLLKEKDAIVVRLTKEKEDMISLLKEKEAAIRIMKEKEDMVNVKDVTVEDTQRATDESKWLLKEKDAIVVQLTKEKEDMISLLKEKEATIRIMKEKEDLVNIAGGVVSDRKQEIDDDRDRLIKENNDALARLTMEKENITKLLKEKEDVIRLMKEKEDKAVMKKGNVEDRKQATVEDADRSMEEKGDIIRLMKEKEDYSNTIMKLKQELESLRSSHEESSKLLESKKGDVVKLLTDKEMDENIILKLKQELEATKKLHEAQSQQLETKAAKVSKELEQRIKEIELMLEDSTKRRIELEESAESRIQFWKQKQIVVNKFVGLQIKNAQDLRLSSVSIRHEILNCQKRWFEELAGLGQNLKVVTNAAEKYHAALADNRKLFNEIQELKGNIRVYCRIRPFRPWEDEKSTSVEHIGENGELVLSNPTKKGKEGGKNFTFNRVFGPTTTQDMVFKDIQPLIRSVLDGYNVCIFAYGQTGSGKTYTMMGPENAEEKEWGVNYRALNDLFNISHDRRDTIKYELGVQMVEIYNEQIRDLLGSGGSQKKLGIQNTTQPNGLAVPDATMCPVNSTSHVIELMQTGHNNRSMSATALNERSSRSHSVVTIHVQGQDLKTGNTLRGALHLVDLAGSERVDRSAVTGDRLKEAQHINKSLAALGDVIFSLSQKNAHVPYRNSKLTQVLQTSLGGHAKTLMFVQVNPDVASYTETLSTLKFAERVSGVELGVARTNKEGKDVRELMDQLALLKDTILKKDDEIDRLQLLNSSTSRPKSTKNGDSLMKHSSSSPGMTSLGKVASFGSGAASDPDNLSDTSDRHSEAGSLLSTDENQQLGQSSANPEVSALGDVELDGRLSDVSDGGISAGAETDSSVNNVVDQEEKTSSAGKERLVKAVNRVQKLTVPKVGQASSLRPKPRDPSVPKSSVATGVRRSTTTQATAPARTSSTSKRGP